MPSATTSGRGKAPMRSVSSRRSRGPTTRRSGRRSDAAAGVGQCRDEQGESDGDHDHAAATEVVEAGTQPVDDRSDEGERQEEGREVEALGGDGRFEALTAAERGDRRDDRGDEHLRTARSQVTAGTVTMTAYTLPTTQVITAAPVGSTRGRRPGGWRRRARALSPAEISGRPAVRVWRAARTVP